MRKKKNDYFEFLYDFGFSDDEHINLARYLHSICFDWTNKRDENRMYDGLCMRKEFIEVYDEDPSDIPEDSCTMLEFFVGFAWRLERDMIGDADKGDRTKVWVKSMLDNLDIWKFDDEEFETRGGSVYLDIDEFITNWVELKYSADGNGGIFYIENFDGDLRDVEIWNQASFWYTKYFDR